MGRIGWTAAVLIFLLALFTRNSQIFIMSLILSLLGLVVWLWSRYCLSEVTYKRTFGVNRLFFGEQTELLLEVTNAKPLPLAWLRCEDEIPLAVNLAPDERASHYLPGRRLLVNLFSLGLYERVIRRYTITGNQRGAWSYGPALLICGDLFGFRSQHKEIPDTKLLLVYPQLFTLPELGLDTRHPFGDYQTRKRLVDDPLQVRGAREYLPGDTFRHIHWKATARRQELQTKQFEPSASRPLAIFINIRTSRHHFQGTDAELREFAISAGASIARWAHMRGDAIGVYVNSLMYMGRRVSVSPSAHPQQLTRVLETLAYCVGVPYTTIERILQLEAEHLRYGTSIVLISASLSANLRRVLADLHSRGFAITLLGIGGLTLDRALPGVAFQQLDSPLSEMAEATPARDATSNDSTERAATP